MAETGWSRNKRVVAAGSLVLLIVGAILAGVLVDRADKKATSAKDTNSNKAGLVTSSAEIAGSAEDTIFPPIHHVVPVPATEQSSTVAGKVNEIATGTVPGSGSAAGVTPSQAVAGLPPSSKFAEFMGTLGQKEQMVAVSNTAKHALGAGTPTACTPANGKELVKAINTQKCSYVTLTLNSTYELGNVTLQITQPTVIVGNPANRPLINGAKTQRAFHVTGEGYLQLSFVVVNRGNEWKNGPGGEVLYTRGGSVLLEPGTGAVLTGCVFQTPFPTQVDFKISFAIGGHILQLGGELFVTGCTFLNLSPFNMRVAVFLGNDILVVAGFLIETASTHTQVAAFVVASGSGLFVNILGGVGIFTGVVFNRNVMGNLAAGAGIQFAVHGGVAIVTGCSYVTNGALFSFFGAGVHQFVGGGVLINTGMTNNLNFGLLAAAGTGPLTTIGAGIFNHIGGIVAVHMAMQYSSFSGFMNFIGPGSAQYTGISFSRQIGSLSAWGIGGQVSMQNGNVQFVGVPSSLNVGISATWVQGAQFWLGAGSMVEVGCPCNRHFGLRYRGSTGNNAWVGAGNFYLTGSPDLAAGDGYNPPWQAKFWVMGKKSKTGKTGTFKQVVKRALGSGWPLEMDPTFPTLQPRASRFAIADSHFSEKSNGKNVCDPILGTSNPLDECAYKGITMEGCDVAENFMVPGSNGTCTEKPDLNVRDIIANPAFIGGRRKLAAVESGKDVSYIIRTDALLACPSASKCPGVADLKAAVAAHLAPLGHSVRLSVVSDKVDPAVADLYTKKPDSEFSGLESCPHASSFNIYMVTDDKTTYDDANTMLRALNDDPANYKFTDLLKETHPELCVVATDVGFARAVPSVPSGINYKGLSNDMSASVGPAITVKSSASGKPVDEVVAGGSYTLEILNFRKLGGPIALTLHNGDTPKAAPTKISTITPDGRTSTVTWQAPASFSGDFVYFGATQQEVVAYSGLLDFIST